jgi:hypothetical protein
MRQMLLPLLAATAVTACGSMDGIRTKIEEPSCAGPQEIRPVGYNNTVAHPEVAYYVVIKVNCKAMATISASESGRATDGERNGATLRVMVGPREPLLPTRELCRMSDGNLAPAGFAPGHAFHDYNLRCVNQNNAEIVVPMNKDQVTQFVFLRWNQNAEPNAGQPVFKVTFKAAP